MTTNQKPSPVLITFEQFMVALNFIKTISPSDIPLKKNEYIPFDPKLKKPVKNEKLEELKKT